MGHSPRRLEVPEIAAGLRLIAEARASDPLRPVTVIAPSHLAALQLRRRLAELTPFAGVRFEPLARTWHREACDRWRGPSPTC
jgi:hypothetical protein